MGSHCRAWVLTTALAGIATLAGLSAQAVDAWAGTWKLNLAKSRYALGPAPRSAVSRLEPSEDAWKVSQDTIDAQGQPTHVEATVRFNGRDYPVTGTALGNAKVTWALTRIDDHTYASIVKRDGTVTSMARTVVSPDGKIRTTTTTGKNALGQMATNVAVYERQ
ncbi:MAG: hypothetical protein A3G76_05130 [Acidobacteria bacterium RIFCSPLOWO2_12_FULL_65_11]|nr:MAG: hypothetical protein A3H95_10445 [Acidobacteria bacterium RIFCSPLOWO2_02_FULL_64_15]OFW31774.1 MAG: hypothetical protein A3G76_05130 [Acidobacteria bacterium RIFCSPLOWO2_12_FULL_65_11]